MNGQRKQIKSCKKIYPRYRTEPWLGIQRLF